MLPLKDHNPTRHFPYMTVLLIAANVFVYFFVQRPGSSGTSNDLKFSYRYAAIPCEVVQGRPLSQNEILQTIRQGDANACDRTDTVTPAQEVFPNKSIWLAVLSSMFLHGSLAHIGFNMLFLWIFGNNIEDRMRPFPYLLFYLVAGVVAAAAQILSQPNSTVPVIGASGAIAGVMGAYLVLFPNVQILTLIVILIRDIPAKWLLGFWFVLQFFTSPSEGVAWVAHVGGFIFGALLAMLLRDKLRPSRLPAPAY